MYAGCPCVWELKLQTEVTLSTMEAEFIALSQAMIELIPLLGHSFMHARIRST
jgi:hypothetical protein